MRRFPQQIATLQDAMRLLADVDQTHWRGIDESAHAVYVAVRQFPRHPRSGGWPRDVRRRTTR